MTFNFDSAVAQIDHEIAKLQRVRAVLLEFNNGIPTKPEFHGQRGKRMLSASARARIAAAQKARWAKWKRGRAA
jgi:hypothetical protein